MIAEGTFSVPEVRMQLSDLRGTTNMKLCFPGFNHLEKKKCYSISGFPRQLGAEPLPIGLNSRSIPEQKLISVGIQRRDTSETISSEVYEMSV
jgi:hypothetical protein